MFADCVWYPRNYSDFHPFQNGHSFLQPIQKKNKNRRKKPQTLTSLYKCIGFVKVGMCMRCTGYNSASRAMRTSKNSIYKGPVVLSEPVYMSSWRSETFWFELISVFQTQNVFWRPWIWECLAASCFNYIASFIIPVCSYSLSGRDKGLGYLDNTPSQLTYLNESLTGHPRWGKAGHFPDACSHIDVKSTSSAFPQPYKLDRK